MPGRGYARVQHIRAGRAARVGTAGVEWCAMAHIIEREGFDHLPPAAILPDAPRMAVRVDDWRVISGILHVLKIGCRWCLTCRLWSLHDDLQPIQSLVALRLLAQAVGWADGRRCNGKEHRDRQHLRQDAASSAKGALGAGDRLIAFGCRPTEKLIPAPPRFTLTKDERYIDGIVGVIAITGAVRSLPLPRPKRRDSTRGYLSRPQ